MLDTLPSRVLNLLVNVLKECRGLAEAGSSPTHLLLLQITDKYKSQLQELVQDDQQETQ
jgi:hypothetical protein